MDVFNNRMVETGERISEFKERAIEITQCEQQRENKLKTNKQQKINKNKHKKQSHRELKTNEHYHL